MNKDNYHPIYSQNVDDNSKAKKALAIAKEFERKAKNVHVLRMGKTVVVTSNAERLKEFEKHIETGIHGTI